MYGINPLIDLVQKIYELTQLFPKTEDYGLTNQMKSMIDVDKMLTGLIKSLKTRK